MLTLHAIGSILPDGNREGDFNLDKASFRCALR
jgi:hypothetical protein